ncbi:hypothetical protein [Alicyclobacillus fodiniaquatilis]|uniref:Uncharacterized protein n=1 Tax=Alicyclobacillus fodiniaquatilis TaxID=1661150 RepID=A0ABW4JK79_9BACL
MSAVLLRWNTSVRRSLIWEKSRVRRSFSASVFCFPTLYPLGGISTPNVHDFQSQKKYQPVAEELARIRALPTMKYEDVPDVNNTEKYEWVQVQIGPDSKYGRVMFCLKTGIKRSQTMGEFYGTSTVD